MSSELRAAVYQRILTDNIVGLDLEENDTTIWHDREIQAVDGVKGSSVVSHSGTIVGSTLSLGNSLDEKIISLANVFRLLYQKRRYELEDTPLWWNWKHGNVQMRIALERMQRWAASTRPIDVIVLMRYAMTTFYVLADEGGCKGGKELIFDMNAIVEYQKDEERQEKELGNAPYGSETPFAIGIAELLQQIDNTTLPQPFVFPAEDIQFTITWQRKTPTIKADLNDEQTKRLNELKTKNETSTLTLEEKCELFFYGGGNVNVEGLRSSLEEELKDNLDMERRNTLVRCLFQVISYLGKQQRDYGTELFVDISEDGSRVQPMRTLQKILDKVKKKIYRDIGFTPLEMGSKVVFQEKEKEMSQFVKEHLKTLTEEDVKTIVSFLQSVYTQPLENIDDVKKYLEGKGKYVAAEFEEFKKALRKRPDKEKPLQGRVELVSRTTEGISTVKIKMDGITGPRWKTRALPEPIIPDPNAGGMKWLFTIYENKTEIDVPRDEQYNEDMQLNPAIPVLFRVYSKVINMDLSNKVADKAYEILQGFEIYGLLDFTYGNVRGQNDEPEWSKDKNNYQTNYIEQRRSGIPEAAEPVKVFTQLVNEEGEILMDIWSRTELNEDQIKSLESIYDTYRRPDRSFKQVEPDSVQYKEVFPTKKDLVLELEELGYDLKNLLGPQTPNEEKDAQKRYYRYKFDNKSNADYEILVETPIFRNYMMRSYLEKENTKEKLIMLVDNNQAEDPYDDDDWEEWEDELVLAAIGRYRDNANAGTLVDYASEIDFGDNDRPTEEAIEKRLNDLFYESSSKEQILQRVVNEGRLDNVFGTYVANERVTLEEQDTIIKRYARKKFVEDKSRDSLDEDDPDLPAIVRLYAQGNNTRRYLKDLVTEKRRQKRLDTYEIRQYDQYRNRNDIKKILGHWDVLTGIERGFGERRKKILRKSALIDELLSVSGKKLNPTLAMELANYWGKTARGEFSEWWQDKIEANPFRDFTKLTIETGSDEENCSPGLVDWSCSRSYRTTERLTEAFLQWLRLGRKMRIDKTVQEFYGAVALLDLFTEFREKEKGTGKKLISTAQARATNVQIRAGNGIRATAREMQLQPAGANILDESFPQQLQSIVLKIIENLTAEDLGLNVSEPPIDQMSAPKATSEAQETLVSRIKGKLLGLLKADKNKWLTELAENIPESNLNIETDQFKAIIKEMIVSNVKTTIRRILQKRSRPVRMISASNAEQINSLAKRLRHKPAGAGRDSDSDSSDDSGIEASTETDSDDDDSDDDDSDSSDDSDDSDSSDDTDTESNNSTTEPDGSDDSQSKRKALKRKANASVVGNEAKKLKLETDEATEQATAEQVTATEQEAAVVGFLYDNDKEELKFIAELLKCTFDDPCAISSIKAMLAYIKLVCDTELKDKTDEEKEKRKRMKNISNRLLVFKKKLEDQDSDIQDADWTTQLEVLRLMKEEKGWTESRVESFEVLEEKTVWDFYKEKFVVEKVENNPRNTLIERLKKNEATDKAKWDEACSAKAEEIKRRFESYEFVLKEPEEGDKTTIKGWIRAWNDKIEKTDGGEKDDLRVGDGDLNAEFGKGVEWFLFKDQYGTLQGAFSLANRTRREPELYLLLTKDGSEKGLGTFMLLTLFEQDFMKNKFLRLESSKFAFDFYLKMILRYELRLDITNTSTRWQYRRRRRKVDFSKKNLEDTDKYRSEIQALFSNYFRVKKGAYASQQSFEAVEVDISFLEQQHKLYEDIEEKRKAIAGVRKVAKAYLKTRKEEVAKEEEAREEGDYDKALQNIIRLEKQLLKLHQKKKKETKKEAIAKAWKELIDQRVKDVDPLVKDMLDVYSEAVAKYRNAWTTELPILKTVIAYFLQEPAAVLEVLNRVNYLRDGFSTQNSYDAWWIVEAKQIFSNPKDFPSVKDASEIKVGDYLLFDGTDVEGVEYEGTKRFGIIDSVTGDAITYSWGGFDGWDIQDARDSNAKIASSNREMSYGQTIEALKFFDQNDQLEWYDESCRTTLREYVEQEQTFTLPNPPDIDPSQVETVISGGLETGQTKQQLADLKKTLGKKAGEENIPGLSQQYKAKLEEQDALEEVNDIEDARELFKAYEEKKTLDRRYFYLEQIYTIMTVEEDINEDSLDKAIAQKNAQKRLEQTTRSDNILFTPDEWLSLKDAFNAFEDLRDDAVKDEKAYRELLMSMPRTTVDAEKQKEQQFLLQQWNIFRAMQKCNLSNPTDSKTYDECLAEYTKNWNDYCTENKIPALEDNWCKLSPRRIFKAIAEKESDATTAQEGVDAKAEDEAEDEELKELQELYDALPDKRQPDNKYKKRFENWVREDQSEPNFPPKFLKILIQWSPRDVKLYLDSDSDGKDGLRQAEMDLKKSSAKDKEKNEKKVEAWKAFVPVEKYINDGKDLNADEYKSLCTAYEKAFFVYNKAFRSAGKIKEGTNEDTMAKEEDETIRGIFKTNTDEKFPCNMSPAQVESLLNLFSEEILPKTTTDSTVRTETDLEQKVAEFIFEECGGEDWIKAIREEHNKVVERPEGWTEKKWKGDRKRWRTNFKEQKKNEIRKMFLKALPGICAKDIDFADKHKERKLKREEQEDEINKKIVKVLFEEGRYLANRLQTMTSIRALRNTLATVGLEETVDDLWRTRKAILENFKGKAVCDILKREEDKNNWDEVWVKFLLSQKIGLKDVPATADDGKSKKAAIANPESLLQGAENDKALQTESKNFYGDESLFYKELKDFFDRRKPKGKKTWSDLQAKEASNYYRKKSLRYHPDRNANTTPTMFKLLSALYKAMEQAYDKDHQNADDDAVNIRTQHQPEIGDENPLLIYLEERMGKYKEKEIPRNWLMALSIYKTVLKLYELEIKTSKLGLDKRRDEFIKDGKDKISEAFTPDVKQLLRWQEVKEKQSLWKEAKEEEKEKLKLTDEDEALLKKGTEIQREVEKIVTEVCEDEEKLEMFRNLKRDTNPKGAFEDAFVKDYKNDKNEDKKGLFTKIKELQEKCGAESGEWVTNMRDITISMVTGGQVVQKLFTEVFRRRLKFFEKSERRNYSNKVDNLVNREVVGKDPRHYFRIAMKNIVQGEQIVDKRINNKVENEKLARDMTELLGDKEDEKKFSDEEEFNGKESSDDELYEDELYKDDFDEGDFIAPSGEEDSSDEDLEVDETFQYWVDNFDDLDTVQKNAIYEFIFEVYFKPDQHEDLNEFAFKQNKRNLYKYIIQLPRKGAPKRRQEEENRTPEKVFKIFLQETCKERKAPVGQKWYLFEEKPEESAKKTAAKKKTPAKNTAAKKKTAPPPTDASSSDSDDSDSDDSDDSDSDSSDSDSSDSDDSDEAVLASGNDKLIFKRQQNSGVSIDFGRQVPSTATIVRNRGDGDCGYLAFGQWLQKYRQTLPEAETRCNALRGIVANFNLRNSPCNGIVNNAVFEARKKKARKPGAWMQDEELIMLACHFNVCVVVYKDYSDTATITSNSGLQAITDRNAVTYTKVNSDSCNEFLVRDSESTMWLWNNKTTLGVPHYELLVDVTYVDVA